MLNKMTAICFLACSQVLHAAEIVEEPLHSKSKIFSSAAKYAFKASNETNLMERIRILDSAVTGVSMYEEDGYGGASPEGQYAKRLTKDMTKLLFRTIERFIKQEKNSPSKENAFAIALILESTNQMDYAYSFFMYAKELSVLESALKIKESSQKP